MKRALAAGSRSSASPHSRLMIIWMASARRTDSAVGRGDRLVVGVGVQAVAVVVDRAQRLQRGADVVERHLLGVQRPARGLDVVLQLLRPVVGAVAARASRSPRSGGPPGRAPCTRGPCRWRRRRTGSGAKSSIGHAAGEVALDVGEPVGQRERELADRVRARLGDVVAGDRDRVEVADLVRRRTTPGCRPSCAARTRCEKMQVFWPWSSLRMSACTVPRTVRSTPARISAASAAVGSRPSRERKASSCCSIAVLRKMARIVGAGPLIVIDTDVVGSHRSKPA